MSLFRPREFIDCVDHIRLLSWLLLGSLTHTAITKTAGPIVCQPLPLESSSHIADHIMVIMTGFAEQSKVSSWPHLPPTGREREQVFPWCPQPWGEIFPWCPQPLGEIFPWFPQPWGEIFPWFPQPWGEIFPRCPQPLGEIFPWCLQL